ncbi:hypothetical protein HUT11_07390 [Streptomyces seoulensis]|nr:hypothetical protein HUT11_07390 [Streptomyces seoulensis]
MAQIQHVEDLVVAAFADGDEVGQTAVLGEAQRPVEAQGIGVVATGIQGEDLDTSLAGVSDQGSAMPDQLTAEISGTHGRIPGLHRGDDVTEKLCHLIRRGWFDPAQRGTSAEDRQQYTDSVAGVSQAEVEPSGQTLQMEDTCFPARPEYENVCPGEPVGLRH